MACVLSNPPFWIRDHAKGVDWPKVVHGEQSIRLHRSVPPSGKVVAKLRVRDVIDKGIGKGALIVSERALKDAETGDLIATVTHTAFCRGDGGFSAAPRKGVSAHSMPDRRPDMVCDLPTRPETALIYRLSGDLNPLHAVPSHARAAGYERPILHGLATFGFVGHAILRAVCAYDPDRIIAMQGRFSAPIFPGETIRTEMWQDGAMLSFQARTVERDVIVIGNGRAELRNEEGQQ
jgi:acyl dehydratase